MRTAGEHASSTNRSLRRRLHRRRQIQLNTNVEKEKGTENVRIRIVEERSVRRKEGCLTIKSRSSAGKSLRGCLKRMEDHCRDEKTNRNRKIMREHCLSMVPNNPNSKTTQNIPCRASAGHSGRIRRKAKISLHTTGRGGEDFTWQKSAATGRLVWSRWSAVLLTGTLVTGTMV